MTRILLIEDDADLLEILETMLTEEGFEVRKLSDNLDALKQISEDRPDLIIVDYILPEINGGELCAQIKKNPQTKHIPVILMTGYARVLLSLGDYGCSEMIEKPFDRDHLISRVRYHLNSIHTGA